MVFTPIQVFRYFLLFPIVIHTGTNIAFAGDDHSDRAGVSWLTFDEKPLPSGNTATQGKKKLIFELASQDPNTGGFGIRESNFRQTQFDENRVKATSLIDELRQITREALLKIKQDKNPKFFAFLSGHGEPECILTRDENVAYSYDQVFTTILGEIEAAQKATGKTIHLEIVLEACHSGSSIPMLKRLIAQRAAAGMRFDITLFTSSNRNAASISQILLNTIKDRKINGLTDNNWIQLCMKPSRDGCPVYWGENHMLWTNDSEKMSRFIFQLLDSDFEGRETERSRHPIANFLDLDPELRKKVFDKALIEKDKKLLGKYLFKFSKMDYLTKEERERLVDLTLGLVKNDNLNIHTDKIQVLDNLLDRIYVNEPSNQCIQRTLQILERFMGIDSMSDSQKEDTSNLIQRLKNRGKK